jgi:hypothetical protein
MRRAIFRKLAPFPGFSLTGSQKLATDGIEAYLGRIG